MQVLPVARNVTGEVRIDGVSLGSGTEVRVRDDS